MVAGLVAAIAGLTVYNARERKDRQVAEPIAEAAPRIERAVGKHAPTHPVTAKLDGNKYRVAKGLPDEARAADLLAELAKRTRVLLDKLDMRMDAEKRLFARDGTDVTPNIAKLIRKHKNKTLPLTEYHDPSDSTVGSNSDKGESLELCLRNKFKPDEFNSINTLFRVLMHELAHSADFEFRGDGDVAHGDVFRRLHSFLIQEAEKNGLYSCDEYDRTNQRFCGMHLTEDYC